MTYYHERKESALTVADRLELEDSRIDYTKVEFEPGNGWVIVVVPKCHDITDLGDRCEVRHPSGKRMTPAPANRVKPPKPAPASTSGGSPRSGVTAQVHSIADGLKADGTITSRADRAKVMEACTAAGINKATAATQFAKWAKKQGW